jgi:hypothetical protein
MAKYIDVESLVVGYSGHTPDDEFSKGVDFVLNLLDSKLPADVRPVIRGGWKERRKHKWKRNSYGTIDYFAGVDCGYHNGPLCLKCGFSFCEHCHPEGYDSECPVPDYICTVCGSEASERGKYCPNCGADMRGENDG